MNRLLATALAAVSICGSAHAQQSNPGQPRAYDRALPSYTDDESGYTGGYGARSDDARGDRQPTPQPPGYAPGGYAYDGGYDAGSGGYYDGGDAPPPPPPPGAGPSSYADRVAYWRARADACEAGDMDACAGPD